MKLDLDNKVVLVADNDSDSAAGIIAVLKSEGAVVLACLAEGQTEPAGCDKVYRYDLADETQTVALRDQIAAQYGKLDGIVFQHVDIAASSLETLEADVLVERLFASARAAFVTMQTLGQYVGDCGGGSVVYITTLHDEKPNGYDMAHSMAQGMVGNLVKEASMEYGMSNVRTNQIALGAVDGLVQQFKTERSHFYEGAQFKVPYSRLGTWEDVGNLTAFLLSDRAMFANGARFLLDGGAINEYVDPRANWRAHQAMKAEEEVRS